MTNPIDVWRAHPTLAIQAINAVLSFIVTFAIPGLSAVQAGWIVTVLSAGLGAWNALKVRPVAPAAWQALVTAVAGLLGAYGFHLAQQQIGGLQLAVVSVMAMLTWQSASPVNGPTTVTAPTLRAAGRRSTATHSR